MEAMAHPFFDELRQENLQLPNDVPVPQLFNFTLQGAFHTRSLLTTKSSLTALNAACMTTELSQVDVSVREILVPVHERNETNWPVLEDGSWPDEAAAAARGGSS